MRKLTALVFAAILLLTGCSQKKTVDKQKALYEQGLDLCELMGEMVESNAYSDLVGGSFLEEVRQELEGNYGNPENVYRFIFPDGEALMELVAPEAVDALDEMPQELAQQVMRRFSPMVYISSLNTAKGSSYVAAASVYTASADLEISLEEPVYYLYTFRNGWPVFVTFTPKGSASGMFVFMEDEKISQLPDALEEYGFKTEKLDIQ